MKVIKAILGGSVALGLGLGLFLPLTRRVQADPDSPVPAVLQAGFTLYSSGGADAAVLAWRKGGPLEGDGRAAEQTDGLKQMEHPLGNYKSFEMIETREIGKTSRILFCSLNFGRGAVFASFQMYRATKDWVVQDMEFDTKPEAIMPWLTSVEAK